MTARTDLTRWNRAGLTRFRYVDGNAPAFLEVLREALARRYGAGGERVWDILHDVPDQEDQGQRLERIENQYAADRRDMGWEIVRVFARACHVLTSHVEAYANEGFLGTATQWDHVRRLVEMLDYHPAPPASAATSLVLVAKEGAQGAVAKGFQVKHAPKTGAPVVFETLEDLALDSALNELRPVNHNRNPEPLSGATLRLPGGVKNLKTGEPIVLESDRGAIRAYLIQGVLEQGGETHVTVRPDLSGAFTAGQTVVHTQPSDRLALKGPTPASSTVGRTIRLAEAPGDLEAGEVLHLTDGELVLYCLVVKVEGLAVTLSEAAGELRLASTTVARPEQVSVTSDARGGGRERGIVVRMAGDRRGLLGATVADVCITQGRGSRVVQYQVGETAFHPPDKEDPDAGYTLLTLTTKDEPCREPPQVIWLPPAGGGWAADQYLDAPAGHLPGTIVTEKPKKTAGGDLAVVVRGNQTAWTRLGSVEVDLDAGEATLTAADRWEGGGEFYLADSLVYGHFKQQLRVAGWTDNATPLSGPELELESAPAALKTGVKLLVESPDSGRDPFVTTVAAVRGARVTLADSVPEGSTAGGLVCRGNVVAAGHGEFKGEKVLGSGSAAQSNQAFTLQVEEVSFVADATQLTGVRADIAVRVAGREWKQVATLNDSGPADAHYVVRVTEDGHITVRFGDGTNGRRLPTGTNNLRVSYRKGTGLRGNLPPGSLTKPVKPHALVDAVVQPLPSTGGNDLEGIESLRRNAPASLLTLERAVSLSDFGHLAESHSSVWQARAFSRPSGFGRREVIEVVVVPAGGGPLASLASTLRLFLLSHAVPGVHVVITGYEETSFDVDVELSVDEEAFVAPDVRDAVAGALAAAFALPRRRLGQDVYLSEVYNVVENVAGVTHSTITLNGDAGIRRLPTDEGSVRVLGAAVVRLASAVPVAGPPQVPGTPAPAPGEVERPVGFRACVAVDGVGTAYAQRLAAAGIHTVRDLAALDPDRASVRLSLPRLWEAIAKAQLIMETEPDADVARTVLDRPLVEVAGMARTTLSQLTGQTPERNDALRALVRRLHVALDDAAFASITLREFLRR